MNRKKRGLSFLMMAAFLFLASNAHSAPKTVLVLGDSLSAEYGLVRGTGWVALLESKIKAENFNAQIINASISGDTTSGGESRLPALLKKHRPSVVVIELGGNDGLRGLPLSTVEANLRTMIATAKNARAKVLLIGIRLPPNYGRKYGAQFAEMYGKVARDTKSALVPFLLNGFADRPDMFQTDGIHPKAEAQSIMLDNAWPHLKPLLKQ